MGISTNSTDGRRRRRLVFSDLNSYVSSAKSTSATGTGSALSVDPTIPLARLVSERIWKHIAVWSGLLAVAAALWSWECAAAAVEGADRTDPSSFPHRVTLTFECILLLCTGQLAILIGWLRARSFNDFNGNYLIWRWTGACAFFAAVFVPTGMLQELTTILYSTIRIDDPTLVRVSWIAVSIGICGVLAFQLLKEHRNCVPSWLLLVAAIVFGTGSLVNATAAGGLLSASVSFALPPATWTCLFMSTLLFARHVIHVSCDPPADSAKPDRSRGTTCKVKPGLKDVVQTAAGNTSTLSLRRPATQEPAETALQPTAVSAEAEHAPAGSVVCRDPDTGSREPDRSTDDSTAGSIPLPGKTLKTGQRKQRTGKSNRRKSGRRRAA